MQLPLARGTYTDAGAQFRTSYPRNLVPVIKDTGISKMFVRSHEGLTRFDLFPPSLSGFDRGGINWQGTCYRVIGTNFVSVSASGLVTVLGQLPNDGNPVAMAYGYPNQGIGIVSGGQLWFWTIQTPAGGTNATPSLQQCTDTNVGHPIDLIWMAGYFVMTDGTYCYVTQLANQFTINSQLYGSDSNSADGLNGLMQFRNELYMFNRYTIAVFDNTGGTGFPFTENIGAVIPKGLVGPWAKCLTNQGFAFVGNSQKEAPDVWISVGLGIAQPVATREVQMLLGKYPDSMLYYATLEYWKNTEQEFLYLHLPDWTLAYDIKTSQAAGEPIWFFLDSSANGTGPWRAWHPVYAYGKFIFGDKQDQRMGYLDPTTAQQYGVDARWQFETIFAYNKSAGAIVKSLELIGTYGRAALGENDTMSMQYTDDGRTWCAPRNISMGEPGRTTKRAQWRPKHKFRNFRGYRFSGYNAAPISFAALEADFEPLAA
jgi:hypothetical protein